MTEVSLDIINPNSIRRGMMRANAILRRAGLVVAVLCFGMAGRAPMALAQDVGVDVG